MGPGTHFSGTDWSQDTSGPGGWRNLDKTRSDCRHKQLPARGSGAGAWMGLSWAVAGQGSACNIPGSKAWGAAETGLGLAGQGTAGKDGLGWGPSLKAPARFWRGPTATQRAGFCANRPCSSCSGSWRAAGGQRGGAARQPLTSRWPVFTSSTQAELECCPLPGTSSL